MILRIIPTLAIALALAACVPAENRRPDPAQADSSAAAMSLGLSLMRQNDLPAALQQAKKALAANPESPDANNLAGLIYERMGDIALAESHFKRAVTAAPDDAYTHNNYGTFLCQLGRIYEAEEQFLEAVYDKNYATPEVAYSNAGVCVRRIPDLDRAAQYFRAALDIKPDMPSALINIARINFEKDRHEQARKDLSTFMQVAPASPKALLLGAQIERALGQEGSARAFEVRLAEQFPDSEEYQFLLQQQ